jgi:hypothetical protein
VCWKGDLIQKRYELLDISSLSISQKNQLRNINQQISNINDNEANEKRDLITQIREILLQNKIKELV